MTRLSRDTYGPDGYVLDGFDYGVQVWVSGGVVQPCGHPERMRRLGPCCPADRYKGQLVQRVPGAERQLDTEHPGGALAEGPDAERWGG